MFSTNHLATTSAVSVSFDATRCIRLVRQSKKVVTVLWPLFVSGRYAMASIDSDTCRQSSIFSGSRIPNGFDLLSFISWHTKYPRHKMRPLDMIF